METATRPLFLLPGQSVRANAKNRVLSAFAFDEASLGSRVQALGGVRFDAVAFTETAFAIDKSWNRLSPFVGASVELHRFARVFAGFSTGFSPASTLALGSREPEETRQLEGGFRFSSSDGSARASLTGFDLTRNNITVPDGSGQPRPTGDQRSRGLEVEGHLDRARLGASASYSFTDGILSRFSEVGIVGFDSATFQPVQGVLDRSGNASPFAPRHLFSVRARLDLGRGLLATAAFRAASDQFISEDNGFTILGLPLRGRGPFLHPGRGQDLAHRRQSAGREDLHPGLFALLRPAGAVPPAERPPRSPLRPEESLARSPSSRKGQQALGLPRNPRISRAPRRPRQGDRSLSISRKRREARSGSISARSSTSIPGRRSRPSPICRSLGFFQDEWLRCRDPPGFVPKAFADKPIYVFETGGTTGMPKSRISIDDFRHRLRALQRHPARRVLPEGRRLAAGRALRARGACASPSSTSPSSAAASASWSTSTRAG